MQLAKIRIVNFENKDVIATSCISLMANGNWSEKSYSTWYHDEMNGFILEGYDVSQLHSADGTETLIITANEQCYVDGVATGNEHGQYVFTEGSYYHYNTDEADNNWTDVKHYILCTDSSHHAQ